jgi:hypothetical protein
LTRTGAALRPASSPTGNGWSRAGVVAGIASGALLVAFAVAAARWYPIDALGVAAVSAISVSYLAHVAHLGLGDRLARVLPRAGADRVRLTTAPLALTTGLSVVVGGVFLLGLGAWAPSLVGLRQSAATIVIVLAAEVAVAAHALGEGVVAGFGFGRWIPALRLGIGTARIAMLAVLSGQSGWVGDFGPFLAWTIPVAVAALGVAVWAWRWLVADSGDDIDTDRAVARLRTSDRSLRALVSTAWPAWAIDASRWAVILLVPLVVLGRLGSASVTHLLAAGAVAYPIYRLSDALAEALTTGPGSPGASRDRQILHQGLVAAGLSVPVAVVGGILAPVILGLFGPGFAAEAGGLLRLFLVAAVPGGLVRGHLAHLRLAGRSGTVVFLEGTASVLGSALTWALIGGGHLTGAGLAWLVVAVLGAAYAVADGSLWWWAPRLGGRAARFTGSIARLGRRWLWLRNRRAMNDQVDANLGALYPTLPPWHRLAWDLDRQSIAVDGHDGRPPLRLELARTSLGSDRLAQRVAAISELTRAGEPSPVQGLAPYPIDYSHETPVTYLVESAISGHGGDELDQAPPLAQRVDAIVEVVVKLHQANPECPTMDQEALDRWVARPLRVLGDGCQVDDDDLMTLGQTLRHGFDGATLPWGRVHGSLRLDRARFDSMGRLIGLLGWDWSGTGPTLVDWGSLTISCLLLEAGDDLGPTVRRLLRGPDVFTDHPAFAPAIHGGIEPKALILFSWLHYLAPELRSAAEHGVGRYWVARNVQPVIATLTAPASAAE